MATRDKRGGRGQPGGQITQITGVRRSELRASETGWDRDQGCPLSSLMDTRGHGKRSVYRLTRLVIFSRVCFLPERKTPMGAWRGSWSAPGVQSSPLLSSPLRKRLLQKTAMVQTRLELGSAFSFRLLLDTSRPTKVPTARGIDWHHSRRDLIRSAAGGAEALQADWVTVMSYTVRRGGAGLRDNEV